MKAAIRRWLGVEPLKKARKRSGFAGAKGGNAFSSWIFSSVNVNELLQAEHNVLRNRARDLARNNFLVKGFGNQADVNVLGPHNIKLQSRVTRANGQLDKTVNDVLEREWKAFAPVCDTTRKNNLRQLDAQLLRCLWRDGELFIHHRNNWDGNRFRYGFKVLDPALVDDKMNKRLSNGNIVRMGVELQGMDGVPVAYWVKDSLLPNNTRSTPIPASEIDHYFIQDEPGQTRGVPWISAAMPNLKHLDGFMEAAVVNARAKALCMGFLESTGDDEADLDEGDDIGADNDTIWNMEAGVIRQTPPGRSFKGFDPGFPDAAMESFVKVVMKAITSSLPGSYASVAGDIENASWSALRNDEMRAKSSWCVVQQLYISMPRKAIYERWLRNALLARQIRLGNQVTFGIQDFERLNMPLWIPPVYPSADELKRQNANKLRLEMGTASRQEIIAEEGKDMEDVDASRLASQESNNQISPSKSMSDAEETEQASTSEDTVTEIKTLFDAYGVGVRAGAITPSIEDENAFREQAGLPPVTEEARQAWEDDGGVRRPITLKGQDQFEAEAKAIEEELED